MTDDAWPTSSNYKPSVAHNDYNTNTIIPWNLYGSSNWTCWYSPTAYSDPLITKYSNTTLTNLIVVTLLKMGSC